MATSSTHVRRNSRPTSQPQHTQHVYLRLGHDASSLHHRCRSRCLVGLSSRAHSERLCNILGPRRPRAFRAPVQHSRPAAQTTSFHFLPRPSTSFHERPLSSTSFPFLPRGHIRRLAAARAALVLSSNENENETANDDDATQEGWLTRRRWRRSRIGVG